MDVYAGTHPVFVSHTKELEQMSYFLADLQHRLQLKGKDSGENMTAFSGSAGCARNSC